MENMLTILMWLAFGAACAYNAKKQKRNPVIWFFIGLFLGIFGLLILLLLPLIQRLRKPQQQSTPAQTPEATVSVLPNQEILKNKVNESSAQAMWYYLSSDKEQKGPMSLNALEREWKNGNVTSSHFLWNETLQDWKRFGEIFPDLET